MNIDQPLVLLVDDSPYFRRYLSLTFSRAAWLVHEWDPQSDGIDFVEKLNIDNLTAVAADWQLGATFNGLEVLRAVRKRGPGIACILYSTRAFDDEWEIARESAREAEIRLLETGSLSPEVVHGAVVDEVRRLHHQFREPRQVWQDYEAWIVPDAQDPRLVHAVESVGRDHLLSIIHSLFPERGPGRPIAYGYLRPGFSGASVFHLKEPAGGAFPGPRYILKMAQGNGGFESLQNERLGFHKLILGGGRREPKLVGYVAEELRPSLDHNEPASADDGWFGIAYREVGNGVGRVMSFQEFYLDGGRADWRLSSLRLEQFLTRLYTDCLGHWFHHSARAVARKLWDSSAAENAFYFLTPAKRFEIFAALDELQPRARTLLDRTGGPNTADRLIGDVAAFIRVGQHGRTYSESSMFDRTLETLEAGTHGDLHAGNVLAIDREGTFDPFVIDFTEFHDNGHPFYDYVRMEADIRLRLMNSEDGSDILEEVFSHWLRQEEALWQVVEPIMPASTFNPRAVGSLSFVHKAYSFIAMIRALAYQNLGVRLRDQKARPSRDSFSLQYTSALLHRTLISLASTDIVPHKRVLALSVSANLIARIGTIIGRMQ